MAGAPHNLVVHLSEHFQFAPGGKGVPSRHWGRFPSRLCETTDRVLSLLERRGVRATFAVDSWIASRHPAAIARIADRGHEVAMVLNRDDAVQELRHALESATGRVVHGAFVGKGWPGTDGDTAELAGLHYVVGMANGNVPDGVRILAGPSYRTTGEWLRMLPAPLVTAYLRWIASEPRTFAFKLWELDPRVERLSFNSGLKRQRAYRNLDAFSDRLERLLDACSFAPIRETLGLSEIRCDRSFESAPLSEVVVSEAAQGVPVSIVVPCYNEEAGLEYLSNTIASVRKEFGRRHRLSFVLVDDGSTDGTWAEMQRLFGADPHFQLVRHDVNRGISAAIQTGCRAARDEVVAVIDSDCSYDPARIEDMLAFLEPDVAIVTASPYHDHGGVEGVPEWRLFLSRGASLLYRGILRNKLATYTSCFRVFRKSAIADLQLSREGYIGIVEMLARLDFEGWRIAEYPVVLETRFIGRSKLRIPRVIAQHLGFMSEILIWRLAGRIPRESARRTC